MQGAYRLFGPGGESIEEFVAAPGPMGWRYFAHVHPPDDPERDRYTVDLVTDLEWNVVRFRLAASDGWRAVVTPTDGGLEVAHGTPEAERVDTFDGVSGLWSASPATLLALSRRLGPRGGTVRGVVIESHAEPVRAELSVAIIGRASVPTASGASDAERIRVTAGGRELEALVRADLTLSADGWFELIA